MRRRRFIEAMMLAGLASSPLRLLANVADQPGAPLLVDSLPHLSGKLTLYLGRGEGGLYEDVLTAIRKRNPDLDLRVRRGPSVALANTLVAEAGAGRVRADLFWSIDAGSLGLVAERAKVPEVPDDLRQCLLPQFRYRSWVPVSGRMRTLPFHSAAAMADQIPDQVMTLPETGYRFGWAPAYGAFQSFVTAMRLLEGEEATRAWLRAMKPRATSYAGEFGVVMAVERGEVDVGFANHYYTLRLKQGKPEARVDLALTRNDAGSLLNASGVLMLKRSPLVEGFVRHLLTQEVQGFLAREAFEIPLVSGVQAPEGLPDVAELQPPELDLERLADLRPTLALMRRSGVL